MKIIFFKLVVIIMISISLTQTERFHAVLNIEKINNCTIFKNFPKFDKEIKIKSEVGIFNECFKEISNNIKLIDLDNEKIILDEIIRHNTFNSENILNPSEMSSPEYFVTNSGSEIKLTHIATGEIIWTSFINENSLFEKYKIYSPYLLITIVAFFITQIGLMPLMVLLRRRKNLNIHRHTFKEAINYINNGNINEGINEMILCSKLDYCKHTKDKSINYLKNLKRIGV